MKHQQLVSLGRMGLTVLLTFVHLSSVYGKEPDYRRQHAVMDIRINYSSNSYREYGVEGSMRLPIGKSRWLFSQKGGWISLVQSGNTTVFSMQGPITLASWYVADAFTEEDTTTSIIHISPVFAILSLPSSHIEYALTNHLFIGINNNSEYVLFRGHTGEKGVYYTPSITLSLWDYSYGDAFDSMAIQLLAGRTFLWNFEGPNRSMGWTFGWALRWGIFGPQK